ncbi:lactate utilization protein C [Ferrimonas balearica]|uniref:LutC/YkgG family protein n=1 Tax=Ferrimonas balearica TaxID=44012 RepID=UPI001C999C26|nr:LUD domain-containing protein [Ferrimonas balearica]MBY5922031.1 lactate utilization protein [Ferrimonas balearica]MBY5994629.1 lactate utilization protein [Ferrimonas balearica]
MSSREQILEALGHITLPKQPLPVIDVEPNTEDLVGQYEANLAKVGGTLVKVDSLEAIQTYLNDRIEEGNEVMSLVEGISGNRELNANAHDLRDVDHTLVSAEFAVAENGAVFVKDTVTGHRVAPYITEHLAAVVKADAIYPTMHQAVPAIDLAPGSHGAFIAGPSKTADIEQALVIGAHGASSMTVFLLS